MRNQKYQEIWFMVWQECERWYSNHLNISHQFSLLQTRETPPQVGAGMTPIIKVEDQEKVRMIYLLLVGVMLLLLEHGLGLSPGLLLLWPSQLEGGLILPLFLANLLLWPGLGVRFGLLALPGLWPPPCTWASNQHQHSYQQDQEDQLV